MAHNTDLQSPNKTANSLLMMSGELYGAGDSTDRKQIKNGRISPSESPLKIFALAKKKINDVFVNISDYVSSTAEFVSEAKDDNVIDDEMVNKLQQYTSKVLGIQEMLKRDRMKVAFYGRTSNGKSTVINAMLRSKLLPTGLGHTTNCFLQVEGTSGKGTLRTEDGEDKPVSVQSINELAHALSSYRLKTEATVYISWPKNKCALLRDDVVFLDSPGIDITPDMDLWIDQHCLDADVFVLVSNAESTLMQTEKNFFHKVSSRLSKPNIFILHNRWDASAHEPEMQDQVKKQHLERSIKFLSEELNVMDKYEAENRVFFVSARETLITRLNKEEGTLTPSGLLLEGYQSRIIEFINFERKFEECISNTAIKTKFEQHTCNGKEIISELKLLCNGIHEAALKCEDNYCREFKATETKLNTTSFKLDSISEDVAKRIQQIVLEVERKVSQAFNDEIRRLSILVNEFEHTFHPDEFMIALYKKELNAHVDSGFGRNLQNKCSVAIKSAVLSIKETLAENLIDLLSEDIKKHAEYEMPPNRSFEVPSAPQTPSNERRSQDTELVVALMGNFSRLYSRSTLGSLAIVGVIGKAAGWRVICVCGVAYGAFYFYERAMWTRKAKEKSFKKQYVDFAASKLRLIVDLTASNCSHQVKQELETTFDRLNRYVDITKEDLELTKSKLNERIAFYEKIASRANYLKNNASFIETALNSFTKEYLKSAPSKL